MKALSIPGRKTLRRFLYFSDTNYVLSGFRAEYFVSKCPHNCSYHGQCDEIEGVCRCNLLYGGVDCSVPLCPDSCGNTSNKANIRGHCSEEEHANGYDPNSNIKKSRDAHCICKPGFSGDDCSLDENNFVGNTWHFLARQQVTTSRLNYNSSLLPRTSHASVYDPDTDILYIYGGYDLNHLLDDLIAYDFKHGGEWLKYNEQNHVFTSASNCNKREENECKKYLITIFLIFPSGRRIYSFLS